MNPASPFQNWPILWAILKRLSANLDLCDAHRYFVQNFLAEEHVVAEMFATYRLGLSRELSPFAQSESPEDLRKALLRWVQGHRKFVWDYIRDHQRVRNGKSLSFTSRISERDPFDAVLNGVKEDQWFLQLRRLDRILGQNFRIELQQRKHAYNDNEAVELILGLDITYDKIESAFRNYVERKQIAGFNRYIDALNAYYGLQNRFGQPVHVGLAEDFRECFDKDSFSSGTSGPKVRKEYERPDAENNIGTLLRNKLAISDFKEGQAVLLLCYPVSDVKSAAVDFGYDRAVIVRPSVLDVSVNEQSGNDWFCPSGRTYGKCGQAVSVSTDGVHRPCCELIHPQFEAKTEHCVWIGKISGDLPEDPGPFRERHLDHLEKLRCERGLAFCPSYAHTPQSS